MIRLLMFLLLTFQGFGDTILRVEAEDDNRRDYEYQFVMTRQEAHRLDFKLKDIVADYKVQTRRNIAERRGYAEEIYGETNYELIRLQSFRWIIFEDRFERILYTNTPVTDLDDF